jgi:hypothetical protein
MSGLNFAALWCHGALPVTGAFLKAGIEGVREARA